MPDENVAVAAQTEEVKAAKPEPKKSQIEKLADKKKLELQLQKAEKVATVTTSVLDPIAFAQMRNLAADLIAGGAGTADADTPEKMLVKLQAGHELGMSPIQSQNSLYIVNGRVTIWGAAMISRLRLAGWRIKYTEENEEKCTVLITSPNGEEIEDTFLYQDAVDSGYTINSKGFEKVGWKKGQNRKLKMRYGAIAQVVKTYVAEVLGSISGIAEIDIDAPTIIIDSDSGETARDRIQKAERERKDMESKGFDSVPVTPSNG